MRQASGLKVCEPGDLRLGGRPRRTGLYRGSGFERNYENASAGKYVKVNSWKGIRTLFSSRIGSGGSGVLAVAEGTGLRTIKGYTCERLIRKKAKFSPKGTEPDAATILELNFSFSGEEPELVRVSN